MSLQTNLTSLGAGISFLIREMGTKPRPADSPSLCEELSGSSWSPSVPGCSAALARCRRRPGPASVWPWQGLGWG